MSLIHYFAEQGDINSILHEINITWIFSGMSVAESDSIFLNNTLKYFTDNKINNDALSKIVILLQSYLYNHKMRDFYLKRKLKWN
ncbi:hypothetical protein QLH32_05600 [Acinetobacter corruptisaponis]|uniref:Transposase InsH N-terminal domain-containing protein n=1 Tax=Acinetobacter corruptisaponis TaxID=3045147 RepID=A0ABY8S652_9GAMM|nr:hypothetical protein [Acinetobacter sp. KCTC 92772]WHP06941.1 hypothetical protein QLH32_05600 [Acinetobacter sp. KCTC 92772]